MGRWRGSRGMGTVAAVIIMVVVLAVVGAGSYFAFQSSSSSGSSGTSSVTACAPPSSAICKGLSGGHDLYLSEVFRTAGVGSPITFTTQYSGTGKILYYLYNYGDGSALNNTTSSSSAHVYTSPGSYIASVQAKVQGSAQLHDNYNNLLIVPVSARTGGQAQLELPSTSFSVISSTGAVTTSPSAQLLASSSSTITVNATYTSAPSDPSSVPNTPTIVASAGGTISKHTSGPTYAQATVNFSASGAHTITAVASATAAGVTYYENYTWSVFLAPSGVTLNYVYGGTGGSGAASGLKSLHPGTLEVYEYFPGGAYSEDPSYDYETVGFEPIVNVYQTLISYNGSETGSTYSAFVPELATCVPGSPMCEKLYGNGWTGIDGNNYTFVINPNARFYDPSTGNSWPVYPSDVFFSLTRTMAFSTGIAWGATNGWIITQSLLSAGNGSWDSWHGVANTTPLDIFSSMSVNDTGPQGGWCPAAAMTQDDGCITFHADANGHAWPYFLELITDALGSSVTPCGWFSANAQGAGVPYWTQGNISGSGDRPCLLPGGTTTTNSTAFETAIHAIPAKGFDSWAQLVKTPAVGNVQYNMVGSGPYYMKDYVAGTSYLLQANPAYTAPCDFTGCQPAPGTYAHTVSVLWETTPTPGEEAYKAGIADFASVPLPDLSLLLSLVNGGSVSLESFPTISIFFFPIDMNFSVPQAKELVPTTNVPGTFLSYEAIRQFIAHAWPYTTIQNTINERDGITFYTSYGGAIPPGMQYNQPTIDWPSGNPSTNPSTVGGAAWWWAQANNKSSIFYDPQLATNSCSSSSPCVIPTIGQTGAPDVDQRISLWAAQVNSISGGALQLGTADEPFVDNVIDSTTSAPGSNPLANYLLGWAPDYPDPTDYTTPTYLANSTYTEADAVEQQLESIAQGFNSTSCPGTNGSTPSYENYAYWAEQANTVGIPNQCQGMAYAALQYGLTVAAAETTVSVRNTMYYDVESIANGLALYTYFGEQNEVISCAAYLNINSFNSNVTIGGGNDNTWYTATYVASGNGVTDP